MTLTLNHMDKIRRSILENIPKDAEVTRIEFEGPAIAIYAKKPEILIEHGHIIADVVSLIKRRIVIRPDPDVRLPEEEVDKIIRSITPKDANITNIFFDPSIGEVYIEAEKPGVVIGKDGVNIRKIVEQTKWKPLVLKTPAMKSDVLHYIRGTIYTESKERERILRTIGERVFRPPTYRAREVRITALGGFREVGRSAILVQTKESNILLDCGINPGTSRPSEAYPRLDLPEFDLENLDAVIITHAHLDHCAFVPYLYKYGYDGPVYCSPPTAALMTLLQMDYLDVLARQGRPAPYDAKNVKECILHTIPIRYGVVTDITPDTRLTFHNAGHILGSAIVHLHIGEGYYNIVYTSDFKFGKSLLLEPSVCTFPRVETLIMECTYGAPEDVMPPRVQSEQTLISIINETLEKGGKVLIPVPAVGRAQEIMLVLDAYIGRGLLAEVPIFIEGMISEATAIHTAFADYLSSKIRDSILRQGVNPFKSEYFTVLKGYIDREEIAEGEPCIILATSGMLEGGPSIEYFRYLAPDERNAIIFVSYQIEGTLGSRVQKGLKEAQMLNEEGRIEIIKVNMRVETVSGFSGHSDRRQLLSYVRHITPKPERIIICHGERNKCMRMASYLSRTYQVKAIAPENTETIKLR